MENPHKMNYQKTKELFYQSQELIKNENYLEALNILIKISLAFQFYKNLPFRKEQILHIAKKCCEILNKKGLMNEEAWIGYGVILRNGSRVEDSLFVFDSILNRGINKEALLEKAYSLEYVGKIDQALSLLLGGLKLFPFDKMLLNNIATLYEVDEEWDKALNYYNLALDVDNRGGMSYYNKGRILFFLKQYDEALLHFEKALDLYENSDYRIVDVYVFIGDTHFQLNHLRNAEKHYLEVIKLFPKRGEGYFNLADFYFTIGKDIQALKMINKAVDLSPPCIDYFYKKAYILNYLNQSKYALITIKEAYLHFPDEPKLMDFHGDILMSQGKYRSAIKIFSNRLKQDIDEELYFLIAKCYFQIEDYTDALFWINKYIQGENFFNEAYILRAKINTATGYYQLALTDLYKALELEEEEFFLQDSDWYYFENLLHIEEYQHFLKKVGR